MCKYLFSLIIVILFSFNARGSDTFEGFFSPQNVRFKQFRKDQTRLGMDEFKRAFEMVKQVYTKDSQGLPFEVLLHLRVSEQAEFCRVPLTDKHLRLMQGLIEQNPNFRELKLFECGVDENLVRLFEDFPSHMIALDLEGNSIGDNGLAALSQMQNFTTLKLWKNGITDAGLISLQQNSTFDNILTQPEIYKCNTGENKIFSELPSFNFLKKIIDDEPVSLEQRVLTRLELYRNNITDKGIEALCKLSSLTYLDCRNNKIGDRGAELLSKMLNLRVLRLRYNQITNEGAKHFVHSENLESLELARNHIDQDVITFLEYVMPQHGYLKQLKALPIPRALAIAHGKVVRILTVDGGGIRGILPALILREIEERLARRVNAGTPVFLSKRFDLMGGTSTGGLITLGLGIPGELKTPKFHASDLVSLYKDEGHDIFPSGLFQGVEAIFRNKYSVSPLEKKLEEYFGETVLSQSLIPVLITAQNLGEGRAYLFDSEQAKENPRCDFLTRDVGKSTSAAPTFFPSATVRNVMGDEYNFIDGGVYANNPAPIVLTEAMQRFPDAERYFCLSIGTGQQPPKRRYDELNSAGLVGWAPEIAGELMSSAAELAEQSMRAICQRDPRVELHRIQFELRGDEAKMDNVTAENLFHLENAARTFIGDNNELLDLVVNELYSDYQH